MCPLTGRTGSVPLTRRKSSAPTYLKNQFCAASLKNKFCVHLPKEPVLCPLPLKQLRHWKFLGGCLQNINVNLRPWILFYFSFFILGRNYFLWCEDLFCNYFLLIISSHFYYSFLVFFYRHLYFISRFLIGWFNVDEEYSLAVPRRFACKTYQIAFNLTYQYFYAVASLQPTSFHKRTFFISDVLVWVFLIFASWQLFTLVIYTTNLYRCPAGRIGRRPRSGRRSQHLYCPPRRSGKRSGRPSPRSRPHGQAWSY